MSVYVLAFLIGVVAGLRSMTAPAAVSWAARMHWVHVDDTWLAFLAAPVTSYILTFLAIAELVTDQLPQTPSRKTPFPFGARIVIGALCGCALGAASDSMIVCGVAGALGGVAGTLGGYEFRSRLVKAIGGKDFPIALLEDMIAIGGALWIMAGMQ